MRLLKYLFLFIALLFTSKTFASCPYPSNFPAIAKKPFPPTICYPESGGSGYCKFRLVDNGLDIKAACTNPDGCTDGSYIIDAYAVSGNVFDTPDCDFKPLPEGCQRMSDGSIECTTPDDPEKPTILKCTTDSCSNPDNLRCPVGYVGGYVNGTNTCTKSDKPCDDCIPDPDPDPPCPDCTQNIDSEKIIFAVNNARDVITASINDIGTSFDENLDAMKSKLSEILEKISNLSNANGNNSNDNDKEVDTSALAADTPTRQLTEHEIKDNLFVSSSSSSQCPQDNVLNMNFMGYTLTHSFSYAAICDALHMLSYLVMIFAYMYSAIIVSRS